MNFRSVFGPLNGCRRYPWGAHLLILLPTLLVVGMVIARHGWWGEPVRLVYAAARDARPTLTNVMFVCSKAGSLLLYAIYAFILLRALRRKDDRPCGDRRFILRFLLFSVVITVLFTQMLKSSFGLPRPGVAWPPDHFTLSTSYNAFPSGHTTEITAAALPLALRYRRPALTVALALLVALVGYSRVWLGYHHPVDILGGMLVGSFAARMIHCCGNSRR